MEGSYLVIFLEVWWKTDKCKDALIVTANLNFHISIELVYSDTLLQNQWCFACICKFLSLENTVEKETIVNTSDHASLYLCYTNRKRWDRLDNGRTRGLLAHCL